MGVGHGTWLPGLTREHEQKRRPTGGQPILVKGASSAMTYSSTAKMTT